MDPARTRTQYNIRVVNVSLGQPAGGRSADDPLAKATARLVQAGITVVASAGNFGKLDDGTPVVGGVVSPGYTPEAMTVGALNTRGTVARSDDGVATYSSRGPVGDPEDPSTWELKPDLVAPGNAIVAAGRVGQLSLGELPEQAGARAGRRDVPDAVGVEHGDGGDDRARWRNSFRRSRS